MNKNNDKKVVRQECVLRQLRTKENRKLAYTNKPSRLNQAIGAALKQSVHYRAKYLTGGILAAGVLGLASPTSALATPLPGEVLPLAELDGSNGFEINGELFPNWFGNSVSNAGDLNGDGIDDLVVGAAGSGPYSGTEGVIYVLFGSATGFDTPPDLTSLDGTNGFKINGEAGIGFGGSKLSAAGDINGDGIVDLVIGTPYVDIQHSYTGAVYVVFGSDQGFSSSFSLSELNGENGFKVHGRTEHEFLGRGVSGAGDFNGDGFDDIIFTFENNYHFPATGSYIVFGTNEGFGPSLDPSTLDGSKGMRIFGHIDPFGGTVSAAGDVNGDGIDDIIIGASENSGSSVAGEVTAYVIFGSNQVFDNYFGLYDLNGTNGFKMEGSALGNKIGTSASGAGDVNDDGFDDVIIGVDGSNDAYVVFGSDQAIGATLRLHDLNGANGFMLSGEGAFGTNSPVDVSRAGDVNGDGFDDVLIGVRSIDTDFSQTAGMSFVVFGGDHAFSDQINLIELDGINGITFKGESNLSYLGTSVSGAGDFNGDGIDDFVLGASGFGTNNYDRGSAYVIFGSTQIQDLPKAQLAILSDINGNDNDEVAVLVQDIFSDTVIASVKDSFSGELIQQISFDSNLMPIAMEIMEDIDGNGAPELVVLGDEPARIEIRDSSSGDLQTRMAFSSTITPIDLTIVPDQNGNGVSEMAILNISQSGYVSVVLKDALTKERLSRVSFTSKYTPQEMAILKDINGNGKAELAVLNLDNRYAGTDRVEIRDSDSGVLLNNVFYQRNEEIHFTTKAKRLTVLPDQNSNGSEELVVLREGRVNVRINDSLTDELINHIGYSFFYSPHQVVVTPDLRRDGVPDIGVLGVRTSPSESPYPIPKTVRMKVKDALTETSTGDVFFNKDFQIQDDVEVIYDKNFPDLSMFVYLGKRKSDGKLKVFIKEAASSHLVSKIDF